MIELQLAQFTTFHESVMLLCNVLHWVATIVNTKEENHDIYLQGFLTVFEKTQPKVSALLLCEGKSQKHLLELLQQPPNEYKGRYIACVYSEEPVCVEERKDEEEAEVGEDGEILLKVNPNQEGSINGDAT